MGFAMSTRQVDPPGGDAWREQDQRRRNSGRRKTVGVTLVLALVVAAGAMLAITLADDDVATGSANPPIAPAGSRELAIVDVGTGTSTPFTAPESASEFDVTLDGSMIAYVDLDADGNEQVFAMDADGSSAHQITTGEGGVSVTDGTGPSWSADGSMIAYAREGSDGSELFVVRVADGISS